MNDSGHTAGRTEPNDGAAQRMFASIATVEQSPITLLHLAIIGLCACGFAMDLAGLALGSALSAIFAAPPHILAPAKLAWLVSAAYVGAIIGAPGLGWLADRIGPMKTLRFVACWIGVWSVLAGFARTADELAITRLLEGIGLGGYPPVMIAFLTDIAPFRRRGTMIFLTCGVAYLAPPLAMFAVRWLTSAAPLGIEGWRFPFVFAGIVALLAGLAMIRLPEAPHWLAAKGRLEAVRLTAERIRRSGRIDVFPGASRRADSYRETNARVNVPPMVPPANTSSRRRLLVLCLISFTVPVATVSFPLLTGPILLARHFSLSDTLFYLGLATLGPIVGTLVGGAFIDRFDRRLFMALCAGAMLASVGLFFLTEAKIAMAIALVGFSLFTALYMPAMTMYGAGLFTPSTRARRTSFAWAINRVAAAGAPALLVPLVHRQASTTIAIVLALALTANLIIVAIFGPSEAQT